MEGAEPGNRRRFRHGFYARRQPELERLKKRGISLDIWEWGIVRNRMVINRFIKLAGRKASLHEMLNLYELVGRAVMHIAKIFKARWDLEKLEQAGRKKDERLEALRRIGEELEKRGETKKFQPKY